MRGSFWSLVLALAIIGVAAHQQKPVVNDDTKLHPMPQGNVDKASEAERLAETRVNAVHPVLTRSENNLRSGANTTEPTLTPASVRGGMRLLYRIALGGDARGLEAQPLLQSNVPTVDGMAHDLVVLATMGNIVGAFDAHDGTPIWVRRLGPPIRGSRALDAWLVNDKWGILSTGVIRQRVLYVVAWVSPDGTPARAQHKLYALNLSTGSDMVPPLVLPGSNPTLQRKQRASLTLTEVGGRTTLFIPFGTIQETATGAHGFITAVDVDRWAVTTDFSVTPQGQGGGIWQAGQGLVADAEGYLYAMTGNGSYNGTTDFSESFVKLRYDGSALKVIDHFSPFRDSQRAEAYDDMDLGSGGPSLIPELGLLFGAGKDGILYTLPWRALGKSTIAPVWFTFYPGPNLPATKVYDQLFYGRTHHAHATSVVWKRSDGWIVFCWGENGNLRAWKMAADGPKYLANGAEVASVNSPVPPGGMPGGMLTLSANGQEDGVLWATVPLADANRAITQGYLAAYDASTFGTYGDGSGAIALLWKSEPFTYNKFCPPVVSGSKVFVPTYDGQVLVFGR